MGYNKQNQMKLKDVLLIKVVANKNKIFFNKLDCEPTEDNIYGCEKDSTRNEILSEELSGDKLRMTHEKVKNFKILEDVVNATKDVN